MKNFIVSLSLLLFYIPFCYGGINLNKDSVYHFRTSSLTQIYDIDNNSKEVIEGEEELNFLEVMTD